MTVTETAIKGATTSDVAGLTPMRIPFSEIHEPGAYVSNTTGHLVRIPSDAVKSDRTPVVDLVASEPILFSRISVNPFISLSKARMLACDLDLPVNF
jgi:hypothetical protein